MGNPAKKKTGYYSLKTLIIAYIYKLFIKNRLVY